MESLKIPSSSVRIKSARYDDLQIHCSARYLTRAVANIGNTCDQTFLVRTNSTRTLRWSECIAGKTLLRVFAKRTVNHYWPQHFLNFLPEPQGRDRCGQTADVYRQYSTIDRFFQKSRTFNYCTCFATLGKSATKLTNPISPPSCQQCSNTVIPTIQYAQIRQSIRHVTPLPTRWMPGLY